MSTAPAVRRPLVARRWPRRVLVLVTIGLIVIGSFVGWRLYRQYEDDRRLRETISDLDARDSRWRLEDLEADRAVVPDAENSATVIRSVAAGIMPRILKPGERLLDLRDLNPATALTDKQFRAVIAELKSVESAIAPSLQIEHYPRGRHPINYSPNAIATSLSHADDIGKIQRLVLQPLLLRHLHESDGAAAVRDCICTIHLARSLDDEPLSISQSERIYLVESAARQLERLLGQVTVAEAELARAQAKLAEEVARDNWPQYLRGGRASVHKVMAALARGDLKVSSYRRQQGLGRQNNTVIDEAAEWFNDWYPSGVSAAHAWELSLGTRLLNETSSLPWHERTNAVVAICFDRQAPALAQNWTYTHHMLMLFQSHQALVRCTTMAIAAERYRLRHGEWPAAAADLLPDFLPELLLDPFDGLPLRYKRLPDGVVIYSIGVNRWDDGGRLSPLPIGPPDSDFGVRLWDVNRRRQPPPGEEKQP